MENFDEILLYKHCKERAFIIIHFLPHIIYIYIIQENIHEESLKDHPRLVVEDQDDKWKSYRTKMYKNSKISNLILTDKRPY
jgi:predicted membrane protein